MRRRRENGTGPSSLIGPSRIMMSCFKKEARDDSALYDHVVISPVRSELAG
jgi:hypothetical protein